MKTYVVIVSGLRVKVEASSWGVAVRRAASVFAREKRIPEWARGPLHIRVEEADA